MEQRSARGFHNPKVGSSNLSPATKINNMDVFYGYSKLTAKAILKRELAIYFENSDCNPIKNEEWVKRRMTIIHTRRQTKEEEKDFDLYTKTFAKYSFFIDDKPYYGDIEKVLKVNYEADKNHVSEEERLIIKDKLREGYYKSYNIPKSRQQLNVFLDSLK